MIETRKSFCRFCSCSCGIEVDVDTEQSRVVAIRGDRANPHSLGYSCPRGRAMVEEIHHPDRLLTAKKREGDRWIDITYGQAFDEIAGKLQQILEKNGPRSVATVKGMTTTWNRIAIQFSNAWMNAMRSPALFSDLSTCRPGIVVAGQRFFGNPLTPLGMLGGVFDMQHAEVAMFFGSDPVVTGGVGVMPYPAISKYLRDARKRGMKLIVIDPRRSETAKYADQHLQVKPGEDATLMAAMIKVILDGELYDQEYVGRYVSGVDDLRTAVKDFDTGYAEKRTRVPAEQIIEAATTFAKAGTGAARFGSGLFMGPHSNLTPYLVYVLNALCGRIDRPGGIVSNPGVFRPPAPATPVAVVPQPLFSEEKSRFRGLAGLVLGPGFAEIPLSVLPDEILEPGDGWIRALFVLGCNPVLSIQDQIRTVQAMKDLDLLVVVDPFMTATAKLADYIIPTKHFLERAECTNAHDQILEAPFGQYTPAVLDAPAGMPEDWEVIWELAQRMGLALNIPGLPQDHKPTGDELLEGVFSHARVPLAEIKKHPSGAIFGELEHGRTVPGAIAHPDRKMAAGHPEFMQELRKVRAEPVIDLGGYHERDSFSHRMVMIHLDGLFATRGTNLTSMKEKYGSNPACLHPDDARSLGVVDGDLITVDSGYGKIRAAVATSSEIMAGTVGIGFGWGVAPEDEVDVREQGCSPNRLIPNDHLFDPLTGMALQTALPVNLYRES